MTVGTWVLVALLAGTGSIARFMVDGLVGERAGGRWLGGGGFPWGTFVVNISGAALLGGVAGVALTGNALILAGTATLGSYSCAATVCSAPTSCWASTGRPMASASEPASSRPTPRCR
jgi:CrcB protein